MTRRTRAFTIIELMTVVGIIGVMAALAVISLKRSRSEGDVDAWTSNLRNLVNQAHHRATSTNHVYLIDLRNQQAQLCQADDNLTCGCALSCPAGSWMTTCPSTLTGAESGGIQHAGVGAWTDSYVATGTDVVQPGVTYAAPSRTSLSGSHTIYFGPTGYVDDTYANVCPNSSTAARGFDIYVRTSDNVANVDTQTQKHRRIAIYGISGRPRIIDNW